MIDGDMRVCVTDDMRVCVTDDVRVCMTYDDMRVFATVGDVSDMCD